MIKIIKLFSIFCGIIFLTQCASVNQIPNADNLKEYAKIGYHFLKQDRPDLAQKAFSRGLKYDPANCQINFLNALSYHIMAHKGNIKLLDLAEAGYKIAIRYCPNDPWPRYYYALLAISKRDYTLAEDLLTKIYKQGDEYEADFIEALIVASYNNGDLVRAYRLTKILKNLKPHNLLVAEMEKMLPDRLIDILPKSHSIHKSIKKSIARSEEKKQLIVDAVIILNDETFGSINGVNLLDGLNLQYGGQAKFSREKIGSTITNSSLITHTITIPDVTYSLNIFNSQTAKTQILARPTLIAQNGKTSTFFSGRKLLLGISGPNSSSIRTFPVGVEMNLTPEFQKDGSINLKVKVARDFLIPTTSGLVNFREVASELGEEVTTTVNIHFGETAILSALAENDLSDTNDRTPLLGHIPIIKTLFNHEEHTFSHASVLILLTPEPYKSFYTAPDIVGARKTAYLFNNIVDPRTNIPTVVNYLSDIDLYQKIPIIYDTIYSIDLMHKAADIEYFKLENRKY